MSLFPAPPLPLPSPALPSCNTRRIRVANSHSRGLYIGETTDERVARSGKIKEEAEKGRREGRGKEREREREEANG